MITVDRLSGRELPVGLADKLWQLSLLSSPAFASVWKTMGGRETYWIVSENTEPCAVLAGVEWGAWPLARFQAMPYGLSARIYLDPSVQKRSAQVVQNLLESIARAGYAKVFVQDFGSYLPVLGVFKKVVCTTTLVDVRGADWRVPSRTLRQEVQQAERAGLTIESFDSALDMNTFLDLVRESDRRTGRRNRYSPLFFKSLAELALQDKRLLWTVARSEQKLVASHIYVIDGARALWWHTYFDKSAQHLNPNQFLLLRTIEMLNSQGITHVNLGSTPEQAVGAAAFKQKLGGVTYEYPSYQHLSWLGRFL